jgi:hypothetical protein
VDGGGLLPRKLVVEGLDEDDEVRLIELLRRALGMDVGP